MTLVNDSYRYMCSSENEQQYEPSDQYPESRFETVFQVASDFGRIRQQLSSNASIPLPWQPQQIAMYQV